MLANLNNNNVVVIGENKVFNHIVKFIDRASVDSENTATEYKRDIERFFNEIYGKDIRFVTMQDLDVKRSDVEAYQTFLFRSGYKSATINRMVASVRSLYNSFEADGFKYRDSDGEIQYIKAAPLAVDKIEKYDADGHGLLSHEEMRDLIEFAKSQENGEEKSLLVELASVTSFRLQALCDLVWSDFRLEGDTWIVETKDKGKQHVKAVRNDLYERLAKTRKDEKVFHMNERTFQRVVESFVKKRNIDPDRNISFHSIKQYGIMEVWMATGGDVMKTAKQGNHSSFETTKKYYMKFETDHSKDPSLLIGQKLDVTPLEEMSKEGLLELILSMDRGTQYQLLSKVKERVIV